MGTGVAAAPLSEETVSRSEVVDKGPLDAAVIGDASDMFHQLPPVVTVARNLSSGHTHLGAGNMLLDRFGTGADETLCIDTAHENFVVKPGGKVGAVFHRFTLDGGDFVKGFVVSAPDGVEIGDGFVLFLHFCTEILETVD